MGDTTNDPWAQAAGGNNGGQESRQAAYGSGPSRFFQPQGGAPTLMNRSHGVGTKRTGIISKPPYDQQRTSMKGEPLFWVPGQKSPQPEAVTNGVANRKVMDTVIELDTEYVMDAAEAAALNRETPYEGGERRDFVGKEIKAFMKAIEDARSRGIVLNSDEDMVGKRLTKTRVSTKPNPNGGDPIKIHEYRIDNA